MDLDLFFFTLAPYQQAIVGAMVGIVPCWVWGRFGGDAILEGSWFSRHPVVLSFLKAIHHWELGVAILIGGLFLQNFSSHANFVVGWGAGVFFDDFLFHSFSNYFDRSLNRASGSS